MAKKNKKSKKKKKVTKRNVQTFNGSVSDKHYEAENAADTLNRATEIEDQPGLLRRAKAVLKRRQNLIAKTIRKKR